MIHMGDITGLDGAALPPVDCITGGSPCQDLSIAGRRAGLAGERSGLFMEQIRIVKEMRAHDRQAGRTGTDIRPRFMVWENVPGALSSGRPKGADFAAVLAEIVGIAEPGARLCVRIPDAGWPGAGLYYADDGAWSIAWRVHDAQFWGVPQRRKRIALVADLGGLAAPEVLFERKGLPGDPDQGGPEGEAPSAGAGTDPAAAVTLRIRGGCEGGGKGALIQVERSGALGCGQDQTLLCLGGARAAGFDYEHGATARSVGFEYEVAPALNASNPCAVLDDTDTRREACARRFTPTECERLQGYPDGWTDIGDWVDGRGRVRRTSDAARYRALGNSIALPFWDWLLGRISALYGRAATLGSLFDGIGGFPLCWERHNGAGTALWASEIEPFCVAVTKRRFGGPTEGEADKREVKM